MSTDSYPRDATWRDWAASASEMLETFAAVKGEQSGNMARFTVNMISLSRLLGAVECGAAPAETLRIGIKLIVLACSCAESMSGLTADQRQEAVDLAKLITQRAIDAEQRGQT